MRYAVAGTEDREPGTEDRRTDNLGSRISDPGSRTLAFRIFASTIQP
jgi:hypothetical protein